MPAEDPAAPWGADSEYGTLRDVLLCRPDHFRWLPTNSISKATLAAGLTFDHDLAMRQHAEMVDAYRDAGVNVHFLEPDPALPYQVYAATSNFMTPFGAVVTQLHQWWRRGEYAPVIRFYQEAGIPIWRMITASAFEGGDFDVIEPGSVLIGYCGERTQEPAARQVAEWVAAEGWEVRLQPIAEHYVHIDLMVCMLAPKLAAIARTPRTTRWSTGCGKGIELRARQLPGHHEARVQRRRAGQRPRHLDVRVHRPHARLRALGFTVYDPDVTMFTLGGGGVHCMCQSLRRDPA